MHYRRRIRAGRFGHRVVGAGADRPLPHATLEIVANGHRETAYADREGRFLVRVPDAGEWALTAYDSGFGEITQQISRATGEPLVVRLRYAGTQEVADDERLDGVGRCPWHLFAHEGR